MAALIKKSPWAEGKQLNICFVQELNVLCCRGWTGCTDSEVSLGKRKEPLVGNTAVEILLFQPLPQGPRSDFSQMIGTCSLCLTETSKLQEDPWAVLST